jgi:hypothetical protein
MMVDDAHAARPLQPLRREMTKFGVRMPERKFPS